MNTILSLNLLQATVQVAAPLMLAAMGGVLSHQAGIFNFSLEGLMLFGAFFAVYGTILTNNPLVGALIAALVAMLVSLVFGLVVIQLRADVIIAAFGIREPEVELGSTNANVWPLRESSEVRSASSFRAMMIEW